MSEAVSGLRSLAEMAHILTTQHQLHDLLETAADHACDALGAATVSISQLRPDGNSVRTIINVGDLGDVEERWPIDEIYDVREDPGLLAAIRHRASFIESIEDEGRVADENAMLERLGKGCSLATPIFVDGDVWGEFFATRHVGAMVFDDDGVAYAQVLAAILGAAISRSLREATLQEMAFHDPLTGLLNRRALDEHAARLFSVDDDRARSVAVVAIDINGLKQINDSAGHAEGDLVIRAVATALERAFEPHPSSVVARVGGDEFIALVSGHDVDMVEQTVNVLCRAVAEESSRVMLSAGIAAVVVDRTSRGLQSSTFAAADEALYRAKRTGSLQAVIAERVAV